MKEIWAWWLGLTKTIENHIIVILRFPIYITFYPFNFLMYFSVLSMELIIIEQVPFKPYCFISRVNFISKVEKTLKGSLDLIPSPSPSVKIQIMGGKVCLRCKGKTLLGVVNKLLKTKSLLTSPSNVLPYYLK